jgi:hypothetical protein
LSFSLEISSVAVGNAPCLMKIATGFYPAPVADCDRKKPARRANG